jgi:hypothetical protein
MNSRPAAAGADHVHLDPTILHPVRILSQEPPIANEQGVDVRCEVVRGAGSVAADRPAEQRVPPHVTGQAGATAVVVQHSTTRVSHPPITKAAAWRIRGVGEDLRGHRLGPVPERDMDVGVEAGGEPGADLVSRGG